MKLVYPARRQCIQKRGLGPWWRSGEAPWIDRPLRCCRDSMVVAPYHSGLGSLSFARYAKRPRVLRFGGTGCQLTATLKLLDREATRPYYTDGRLNSDTPGTPYYSFRGLQRPASVSTVEWNAEKCQEEGAAKYYFSPGASCDQLGRWN